jgi:hypothetical protein
VEAQRFGKIFEETYQLICNNDEAWWSNEENVYSIFSDYLRDEWLDEAITIAKAFHQEHIRGLACDVSFRKIRGDRYIAAKPDLFDKSTGLYIEFKTYALDEYARMQAKVFSWVHQSKVLLVGWDGSNVQKEIIDGTNLKIPYIPYEEFSDTYRGKVDPMYISPRRRYSPRYCHYDDFYDEDFDEFDEFDDEFDDFDRFYF